MAADAQLLVVGNRSHRAMRGLLTGSVSHALLRRAPCPIAVVPLG
jgi:nucleotide-binding universal stress UspA family protein